MLKGQKNQYWTNCIFGKSGQIMKRRRRKAGLAGIRISIVLNYAEQLLSKIICSMKTDMDISVRLFLMLREVR